MTKKKKESFWDKFAKYGFAFAIGALVTFLIILNQNNNFKKTPQEIETEKEIEFCNFCKIARYDYRCEGYENRCNFITKCHNRTYAESKEKYFLNMSCVMNLSITS